MSSDRTWYAGRVTRRSGTRAPVDVLASRECDAWKPLTEPRKLFPKTGQVELQGPAALDASSGEWVVFQASEKGHPGARLARAAIHRFLPRFADLRDLGTVEAARFLFTREGWADSSDAGHWAIRFCDARVLSLLLERSRDGRLRCPERRLGKVACLPFREDGVSPEPAGTTGRPVYDARDDVPIATYDWSASADYVAHVVRALAGADDPRLPELITWLELHKEEKTGRVSAIGTNAEVAFEALRSGELAARLIADREVMTAYLAAATRDPAVAAVVVEAVARGARLARDDARAGAERELAAEFSRLTTEQEARIADREAGLWKEAEIRLADRERALVAELEARQAALFAVEEEGAARQLAEAADRLAATRQECARAEERGRDLAERILTLEAEAERLRIEAEAAASLVGQAERDLANVARRAASMPRPVALVAGVNATEVETFGTADFQRRVDACPLLTPAGRSLMAAFVASMLAGEVPVLRGEQVDDFALVAEGLVAAGRLVPFDADETVIAPDDIWSRPGSGLASQVSQAAALASEGQVYLVQLRGIERSAARFWHPALASLARRGLLPRRLLLFASLNDPSAREATALPADTCVMLVEDAVVDGAAILAPRLLAPVADTIAGRLEPGERPIDLSSAIGPVAALAATGVRLGISTAVRTARVVTEATALTPGDGAAAELAARRFMSAIGVERGA